MPRIRKPSAAGKEVSRGDISHPFCLASTRGSRRSGHYKLPGQFDWRTVPTGPRSERYRARENPVDALRRNREMRKQNRVRHSEPTEPGHRPLEALKNWFGATTEQHVLDSSSEGYPEMETDSEYSHRPSLSSSAEGSRTPYCPEVEMTDVEDELYGRSGFSSMPSRRLMRPDVAADEHKKRYHNGRNVLLQFDRRLFYVNDMLKYMWEKYQCITAYSLGMIDPGTIIYFLEGYTVDPACGTEFGRIANVGGANSTARVKQKGRFAIVTGVARDRIHLKVNRITTFHKKGLRDKPQAVWGDYVGIRSTEAVSDYLHPSGNEPLEVGSSVCEIHKDASVHLMTTTISLGDQILIAGNITSDSLQRLHRLIQQMDERMFR